MQGVALTESIRSYPDKSVELFTLTYDRAATKPVVAFPDFDQLPAKSHVMSFREKVHAPGGVRAAGKRVAVADF